jgi:hypothetical protein
MPAVFWQIDLQRALTSGRGQRWLRDIEAALLALPKHELSYENIVELGEWDDEGDTRKPVGVCAVGAVAAYQKVKAGATWDQAFADLAESWDGERDCWETQQLGMSIGLTRTVAWELAYQNDEMFESLNPSERHAAMLGWVRSHIKSEVPA